MKTENDLQDTNNVAQLKQLEFEVLLEFPDGDENQGCGQRG